MLEYTTKISDDTRVITITFISLVNLDGSGSVIDLLDEENAVDYNMDEDTSTITFISDRDTVYLLSFSDINTNEYYNSYLLVSSKGILKSNQLNRVDVDNYLKVKKLTVNSRVVDCLNRVAIANYRLGKELRAAQILDLISKQEIC